ncbi:MAG: S49 family peptidase [Hyphomicrobiaceae bacterium]
MLSLSRKPVVPVLRLYGQIGMPSAMKSGLTMANTASAIEKAFSLSKTPSVAIQINSPGGSPVQSHLIFKRIRQLAEEKKKTVYVFCEDVAASGGYFLAVAGDEIHADPSSIIGSIGVISAGFGLDKAIEKLGIERRVYTAGTSKGALDPFLPEKPDDVARLKAIQGDVHETFVSIVKNRRGARLTQTDPDLFTGAFWSGVRARELGLVDGHADVRSRMRELHGDKVRLRVVTVGQGGLLSRLRRLPGLRSASATIEPSIAEDVMATLDARAIWSRYGL